MPSFSQAVIRKRMPTTPVRDRLASAQAERAERINRVESGELVKSVEVDAEWRDIAATIRTRLLETSSRVAARHPGHPEIIATIDDEIRAALNDLANDEWGPL